MQKIWKTRTGFIVWKAETGEAGSGESIPAVVRGKGSACDQSAFSGIGAVSGFAGTFGSRQIIFKKN